MALGAQTNLTVDIDDPIYLLIEMAEVKGLISRVSQIHPYPVTQVKEYLETMNAKRGRLSSNEQRVLDEQLRRFGIIQQEREKSIWETGRLDIGGEQGTKMENFPMTFRGAVNNITNAEINAKAIQNVTIVEGSVEGDITSAFSYGFNLGFGASYLNDQAFAPFAHKTFNDGFALALSGGLRNSTDYEGFTVTFHFNPEMQAQFFDNRLRLGFGRYSRNLGMGTSSLMVSDTARPYDALELSFRPASWIHYYYSVGSLGNWFSQSDWLDPATDDKTFAIDEKNITLQTLELMPWDWLYGSFTTGAVWGKRMELSYFNPLMPLLFAQNLYGDSDNLVMELSGSVQLPFGVKLYGTFFSDENQLHKIKTLFTSTSQQFALQGGVKALIPGLGFTLATFQYTKLEPYVYTHYEQKYPHSTPPVNTNWTNDRYNLGYYLPPNSDEFHFGIESMPVAGLQIYGSYRYIRHGYGNIAAGEIPGTVNSGGGFDDKYAYEAGTKKNFLKDGPYEKIHMAVIGAWYQFPNLPLNIGLQYSFSFAQNDGPQSTELGSEPAENVKYWAYTPYSGFANAVSLSVHIYPEY